MQNENHVSFIQKGNGKDLLFLHGYLSSKEAFTRQIAYFSRFFRVTAIDFIGFGKSEKLFQPFSVGDYAEWLKGVLKTLDVKNPNVVAHSFGCRVAIKLASEDPTIFNKMVLTGPAGVILNRGFSYHCKVKAYRIMKRIAPTFAQRSFGSAEYRSLSPIMQESYKKIVNEDLRSCAARVENPVLIVEGTQDKTTPLKEAEAYLQVLKNGKMKMIEGGHFAFVENPVRFNLIVEEFLYE